LDIELSTNDVHWANRYQVKYNKSFPAAIALLAFP